MNGNGVRRVLGHLVLGRDVRWHNVAVFECKLETILNRNLPCIAVVVNAAKLYPYENRCSQITATNN